MPKKINIVWFKRDLRLSDHQPLKNAFSNGLPTLLLYNFEPLMLADPHYNERHWRFVYQSIMEINTQLKRFKATLYVFNQDMLELLSTLNSQYRIENIFSHQEIGLNNTFDRDELVRHWCKTHNINWFESQTGAVIRGKKIAVIGTNVGNKQCKLTSQPLIGKT